MNNIQLNSVFEQSIVRWFADKAEALRSEYELNENSVVLDIGGYKGEWAESIFKKAPCNIHIFEPLKSFYDNIVTKFNGNDKIKVYHFGLGGFTKDVQLTLDTDASSAYKKSESMETVSIKNVSEFIQTFEKIDLMKINIEGEEYDLLDDLIKTGSTFKIVNIQVQFHTFVDGCVERRNAIIAELAKTHDITYNYDFVWENWKLKIKV